jgi:hypothetical protein
MIPLAVLTWFRTNPRNVWLIAGLLAVIAVLAITYQRGRHDAAEKAAAARAVEVVAAIQVDARADTKGAAVALQKAQQAADRKEELIDAVAKAPDDLPDESSVRWGCELLRQQGKRPADIPECRALGI